MHIVPMPGTMAPQCPQEDSKKLNEYANKMDPLGRLIPAQ